MVITNIDNKIGVLFGPSFVLVAVLVIIGAFVTDNGVRRTDVLDDHILVFRVLAAEPFKEGERLWLAVRGRTIRVSSGLKITRSSDNFI